jgi:hypothetical protein
LLLRNFLFVIGAQAKCNRVFVPNVNKTLVCPWRAI